jgi:hypothetical protein
MAKSAHDVESGVVGVNTGLIIPDDGRPPQRRSG